MGESLPRAMLHEHPPSLYIFPKSWCSVIKRSHCARAIWQQRTFVKGRSASAKRVACRTGKLSLSCAGDTATSLPAPSSWVHGDHLNPPPPAPQKHSESFQYLTHPVIGTWHLREKQGFNTMYCNYFISPLFSIANTMCRKMEFCFLKPHCS